MPHVEFEAVAGTTYRIVVDGVLDANVRFDISVADVTVFDLPLPAGAVGMLDFTNQVYKWGDTLYASTEVVDHPEFIIPGLGCYLAPYDLIFFDDFPPISPLGPFRDHMLTGDWTMVIEFSCDGWTAPFVLGDASDPWNIYSEYEFFSWMYVYDNFGNPYREFWREDTDAIYPDPVVYNIIAYTRTPSRIAMQVAYGYKFQDYPLEHITDDLETTPPLISISFGGQETAGDNCLISRIVFYPSMPTAALTTLIRDPIRPTCPNDDFEFPIILGPGLTIQTHNYGATWQEGEMVESGLPAFIQSSGNSVWFLFVPPATANYDIVVAGIGDFSGWGAVIRCFTGNTLGSLTLIGEVEDWPGGTLTFAAVGGTPYRIQVDAAGGNFDDFYNISYRPGHGPFTITVVGPDGSIGTGQFRGVSTAVGVSAVTARSVGLAPGFGQVQAASVNTPAPGAGTAAGIGGGIGATNGGVMTGNAAGVGSATGEAWVTTFSTVLGGAGNSGGWSNNYNIRMSIAASQIQFDGGGFIRLWLQAATNEACQIEAMYVGHAALTGDPWDFDGTQVQVTVGGSPTFTIPASDPLSTGTPTAYPTDAITYPLDEARNVVISIRNPQGVFLADAHSLATGVTGTACYFKQFANEASVADVNSYSTQTGQARFVKAIQVYPVGASRRVGTAAGTSTALGVGFFTATQAPGQASGIGAAAAVATVTKASPGNAAGAGNALGDAWVNTYSQALNSDNNNWGNYTLRQHFAPSLLAFSGTSVRIRIEAATVTGFNIDEIYIGHAAASGDPWDFDGTQVRLTNQGSTSFVAGANGSINSDAVTYAFDEARAFIVTAHFTNTGNNIRMRTGVTGATGYYKSNVNEAAVSDVTGYATAGSQLHLVNRIQVVPIPPTGAGLAAGTSTALGVGYSTGEAGAGSASGTSTATAVSPTWTPAVLGANLRAWYKFNELTGANNDPQGALTDASGNSFGLSATTTARATLQTAEQNGLNTLRFVSPQRYVLPNAIFTGKAEGSLFIVYKITSDAANNGLMDWGTSGQFSHWPFSDGVIYCDFGSSARKTVGNPAVTQTTYRIIGVHSAANDWAFYIDGGGGGGTSPFFSTTSNTVSWRATTVQLGANANGDNLTGGVCEVVFVDAKLATTDRQKMEGYLAHKWGLTGNLDGGHPYKTVKPPGPPETSGVVSSVGSASGTGTAFLLTSHRYWRFYCTASLSSNSVNIAEMEMRETAGGSDQTGSGTAAVSSSLSGAATDAFDNNAGSTWHSGIDQMPAWLSYDFGVGVIKDIVQVVITAHPSNPGYSPVDFAIQYSDNNTSWTTSWSVTGQTGWTAGEVRTFTKP